MFFPRKENALEAVNKFNHSDVNGKKIKVSYYENFEENEKSHDSINKKVVINLDEIRAKKDPIILKHKKNIHNDEIMLIDI